MIYNIYDYPEHVFGVPFFKEKRIIERLPENLRRKLPQLDFLGRRCNGARFAFRTDAKTMTVRMKFATLSFDIGMSVYSCQSANVLVGKRRDARLLGLVTPRNYETRECEKTFSLKGEMEEYTICLPRNEIIADFSVEFDDGAQFLMPTPYTHAVPMLFYGSSITEGGCNCRLTNAYTAILSRWLDADYYNFGFSGGAKGEPEIADYFNTIEKSVFIYDYDHNTPSIEHLEKTHEAFFKRIREHDPLLPVLILSRPDFDGNDDAPARREIIRKTWENAVSAGDKNVYFIDGQTYYGDEDRDLCTADGCHPTDLGFYRMAQTIYPVLKQILE